MDMDSNNLQEDEDFLHALDFSFAASASNQRLSEDVGISD